MRPLRVAFVGVCCLSLWFGAYACSTHPSSSDGAAQPEAGATSDAPDSDPMTTTMEIGPEGGVLSVSGVTIEIPAGALDERKTLTLTVTVENQSVTLDVKPDVEFNLGARVSIDDTVLPTALSPVMVFHEIGDESYAIAETAVSANKNVYDTWAFTKHRVNKDCPKVSGFTCGSGPIVADGCKDSWSLCARTPVCAAASVSRVRDSSQRKLIRANVKRATLNLGATCLVSVAANFVHQYAEPTDFAGLRNPLETVLLAPEARNAVIKAADLFRASPLGTKYRLFISGGLDSTGKIRGEDDPHSVGAAVDLGVCQPPAGSCDACGENCTACDYIVPQPPEALAAVAAAATQAGFSWVFYEDRKHVHASVVSPTCGALPAPLADGGPGPVPPVTCTPPHNCGAEELACCKLDQDGGTYPDPWQPGNPRLPGCRAVAACVALPLVAGPSSCPTTTRSTCSGYFPGPVEAAYRQLASCQHPDGGALLIDSMVCACSGMTTSSTGTCPP